MIFADYVAIALSIIGFFLSLQGLWLISLALWPRRVNAAALRCEKNGVASFFVGLALTGVFLLVVAVIGKLGTFGQLTAFSLGFLYMMYAGVGLAGFVTHIGRRLASPADVDRPWKATIRGGVALELAYLIPVLGWFGLLPISLVIGAGATTLSFFKKRAASSAPPMAFERAPIAYAPATRPSPPAVPPPMREAATFEPAGADR